MCPGEITCLFVVRLKPSCDNYVRFHWVLGRPICPWNKNTEAQCPGLSDNEKPAARCLILGQELWPRWSGMKPRPQPTTQAGATWPCLSFKSTVFRIQEMGLQVPRLHRVTGRPRLHHCCRTALEWTFKFLQCFLMCVPGLCSGGGGKPWNWKLRERVRTNKSISYKKKSD